MAARLMGKAEKGTVLVSERVYNSTKDFMSYDVTKPIELKGRNGTLEPLNHCRKPGSVRHKADQQLKNAVFVGRETEMAVLRQGLKQ